MLNIYLSALDQALLVATLIFIAIGFIVLVLCGIYRVKDDQIIIIEKGRKIHKVCTKGIYFFFPIIYQRSATYITAPLIRRYTTRSNVTVDITYQLIDALKFYEAHTTFENIMSVIEKENSDINITVLKNNFNKYGLEFININKVKR